MNYNTITPEDRENMTHEQIQAYIEWINEDERNVNYD